MQELSKREGESQWQAVSMGYQLTDVPPDTCSSVLLKCLPTIIHTEWVSDSLPTNWRLRAVEFTVLCVCRITRRHLISEVFGQALNLPPRSLLEHGATAKPALRAKRYNLGAGHYRTGLPS